MYDYHRELVICFKWHNLGCLQLTWKRVALRWNSSSRITKSACEYVITAFLAADSRWTDWSWIHVIHWSQVCTISPGGSHWRKQSTRPIILCDHGFRLLTSGPATAWLLPQSAVEMSLRSKTLQSRTVRIKENHKIFVQKLMPAIVHLESMPNSPLKGKISGCSFLSIYKNVSSIVTFVANVRTLNQLNKRLMHSWY